MKNDKAMGNSNFDRIDDDFYETPEWVTEILLKHIDFGDEVIWEPAVGKGAIANVLLDTGYSVIGSDLVDRGCNYVVGDFLETTEMMSGSRSIVTNPPYGDAAQAFAEHAISLLPLHGTLVMICRHEWICAKKRRHLFDKNSCFFKQIVLNKRPRWIAGSTGSPRHNYAIYVWRKGHEGQEAQVVLQ